MEKSISYAKRLCEACAHKMSDKISDHHVYQGDPKMCEECNAMGEEPGVVIHLCQMSDDVVVHDDIPPKFEPVNPHDVLDLQRGELLQPTMELRFEERSVTINSVQVERRKFLQQKFVDLGSGKEVWKDVPLVIGE
jgi:hypothetical protein